MQVLRYPKSYFLVVILIVVQFLTQSSETLEMEFHPTDEHHFNAPLHSEEFTSPLRPKIGQQERTLKLIDQKSSQDFNFAENLKSIQALRERHEKLGGMILDDAFQKTSRSINRLNPANLDADHFKSVQQQVGNNEAIANLKNQFREQSKAFQGSKDINFVKFNLDRLHDFKGNLAEDSTLFNSLTKTVNSMAEESKKWSANADQKQQFMQSVPSELNSPSFQMDVKGLHPTDENFSTKLQTFKDSLEAGKQVQERQGKITESLNAIPNEEVKGELQSSLKKLDPLSPSASSQLDKLEGKLNFYNENKDKVESTFAEMGNVQKQARPLHGTRFDVSDYVNPFSHEADSQLQTASDKVQILLNNKGKIEDLQDKAATVTGQLPAELRLDLFDRLRPHTPNFEQEYQRIQGQIEAVSAKNTNPSPSAAQGQSKPAELSAPKVQQSDASVQVKLPSEPLNPSAPLSSPSVERTQNAVTSPQQSQPAASAQQGQPQQVQQSNPLTQQGNLYPQPAALYQQGQQQQQVSTPFSVAVAPKERSSFQLSNGAKMALAGGAGLALVAAFASANSKKHDHSSAN